MFCIPTTTFNIWEKQIPSGNKYYDKLNIIWLFYGQNILINEPINSHLVPT